MHVQIYCNFFCTSSIAVGAALSAMSLFSGQQASVLCLLFVSIVYKGIVLPMCVYALSSVSSESIEWAACCAQGSTFQSLRFYGKWYLECFVYIGHCRSDEIKGSWSTALFSFFFFFFLSLLDNFHRIYRLFSVIDQVSTMDTLCPLDAHLGHSTWLEQLMQLLQESLFIHISRHQAGIKGHLSLK